MQRTVNDDTPYITRVKAMHEVDGEVPISGYLDERDIYKLLHEYANVGEC